MGLVGLQGVERCCLAAPQAEASNGLPAVRWTRADRSWPSGDRQPRTPACARPPEGLERCGLRKRYWSQGVLGWVRRERRPPHASNWRSQRLALADCRHWGGCDRRGCACLVIARAPLWQPHRSGNQGPTFHPPREEVSSMTWRPRTLLPIEQQSSTATTRRRWYLPASYAPARRPRVSMCPSSITSYNETNTASMNGGF